MCSLCVLFAVRCNGLIWDFFLVHFGEAIDWSYCTACELAYEESLICYKFILWKIFRWAFLVLWLPGKLCCGHVAWRILVDAQLLKPSCTKKTWDKPKNTSLILKIYFWEISTVHSIFTVFLQKFEGYNFSEEIFPQHFKSGNKYPYQGKGKKKKEKQTINKPQNSMWNWNTRAQGFKASWIFNY